MISERFVPEYVQTARGRVHVVRTAHGAFPMTVPLLLLHQTPKSWDEFEAFMPLVRDRPVLALDLPGHGASSPLRLNTIEEHAGAVLEVIDVLAIDRFIPVGHHFGGLVAYEIAARAPERAPALVLSSTPYVDAADRERRRGEPPFDRVAPRADGEHLAEIWRRRCEYVPSGDERVLSRHVRDVLQQGVAADAGHDAVAVYRSEDRLGSYGGPVLCIASAKDPRAFPRRGGIRSAFPGSEEVVIAEGSIAVFEERPEELESAISAFLARVGAGE